MIRIFGCIADTTRPAGFATRSGPRLSGCRILISQDRENGLRSLCKPLDLSFIGIPITSLPEPIQKTLAAFQPDTAWDGQTVGQNLHAIVEPVR